MSDEPDNPNPTHYHALLRRNDVMANRLRRAKEFLPEARFFTHAHVSVGSGVVQLLYFRRDPITREQEFERIAIPYDHFMLICRGLVDAHDDAQAVREHDAEFGS
jgi:hypothetical protein